jgi:preprotein translocase subunit SecF
VELLDLSINSTLSRTVMTSVTTILALLALVLFGGPVIEGFAYAMMFGVVVGTYPSISIAAPVLIYLGVKVSSEQAAPAAEPKPARGAPGRPSHDAPAP